MLFKEQTSVKMLLKVYQVHASQKTQNKLSQIGSYINSTVSFCLPLSQLVVQRAIYLTGAGAVVIYLFPLKRCISESCARLMLYLRELSMQQCSQKSPRNSEDIFRTPQDQNLPVKTEEERGRQGTLKASKECTKHANFHQQN